MRFTFSDDPGSGTAGETWPCWSCSGLVELNRPHVRLHIEPNRDGVVHDECKPAAHRELFKPTRQGA